MTASAAIPRPSGTPVCGQLDQKPRRRASPYSKDSRTEPPHSPPTPVPCRKRKTDKMIGAATPRVVYVGKKPINTVAMPISSIVATKVDFRPMRSPNQPKKAPPTGRAAKPTKFVVKAAMVPVKGSSVGKKSFEKTVAEKNVYKKKSYHSIAVPNVLALITGNILRKVVVSL